MESIFEEIRAERIRQDEKFGEQNNNPIEWIAMITEEIGEAAKEAVDYHFANGIVSPEIYKTEKWDPGVSAASDSPEALKIQTSRLDDYRKEMLQVAAMAINAVQCLDRHRGAPMQTCANCHGDFKGLGHLCDPCFDKEAQKVLE